MLLPIDKEKALETVDGDEELFRELVNMLLEQAASRLPRLEHALAVGDVVAVEHLAHSLKGAAANLAAEPLRQAAWELEQLAREGDLANGKAKLEALKEHVVALQDFVRQGHTT